MSNYARCIICRYEYTSQVSIHLTARCPQCGNTSQTLDPREDLTVVVARKPFAGFVDDAANQARWMAQKDPLAFSEAPRVMAAVAGRLKGPLRPAGNTALRANWGEIVLVMRWAEQLATREIQDRRRPPKALEDVILYARDLEAAHPTMRKTTQITVEAEAQVQEVLRLRGPEGIKFLNRPAGPGNPEGV